MYLITMLTSIFQDHRTEVKSLDGLKMHQFLTDFDFIVKIYSVIVYEKLLTTIGFIQYHRYHIRIYILQSYFICLNNVYR